MRPRRPRPRRTRLRLPLLRTDRYLLAAFIPPFLIGLSFVVFMFHVTELFDRLGHFTADKVPPRRILLYFLYKSPFLVCEMMPVAVLFATVFSLAELRRRNETVAILGAGVSFHRMVAPLVGLAALLAVFTAVFHDQVVPPAAHRANLIASDFTGRNPRPPGIQVVYNLRKFGAEGRVFFADRYDDAEKTLHNLVVVDRRRGERLDAERAVWDPERRLWVLSKVRVTAFDDKHVRSVTVVERLERDLGDRPEDFRREHRSVNDMGFAEAREHVRRLKASGYPAAQEEVELHWKFSFPFGVIVMVLIGAPLSAYSRRNVLISSLFSSFVVTLLYYYLLYLGYSLGKSEALPPILGAWIGNIAFTPVIVWLLANAET